jgi:hypothetical protein
MSSKQYDSATYMRKQRGLTQKIYLIEIIQPTSELIRDFIVMGSTGNVYTVSIKYIPSCSCPDNTTRKKNCKHIFFILVKIMNCFNPDLGIYTKEQLKNMFDAIPNITNLLCVDENTKNKYEQLKNKKTDTIQKTLDDDICPICLEDLNNGEELSYCKVKCGKNIHTNCFTMVNSKKINDIICVFCRSPWNKEEKYINLSI